MPTSEPSSIRPGRAPAAVVLLCAAAGLAVATTTAAAQEDLLGPDPELGHELAEQVCSACHLIGPDDTGPVVDGVPTLMSIADTLDDATIESLLMTPAHPAMPEPPLSLEEREHVIAYIRSLEGE